MAFVYWSKSRKKWYARFVDPATGRKVTRAGYRDKLATKQLAARLERDAARRLEGILPANDEHLARPLASHAGDWYEAMLHRGATAKHAAQSRHHLLAVAAGCGWESLRDLDAHRADAWLAAKRSEPPPPGKARNKFGANTSNHYAAALRSFGRWCVRGKRLPADPFAGLRQVNAAADPRHVRRTLSAAELRRLFDAARSGRTYRGLTGPARAALYAAAAYTGLRADELASLTAESLRLGDKPPTLTLAAADDKAGRGAVLPIHPALAETLRNYLPSVPAGSRLWPGPWAEQFDAAALIRRDLKRAGIPYEDDRGQVFDFHALRSQFVTDLALAGVPLQVAQKLARHSTPVLTAKTYTRLGLADLADAVGRLPTDR